MSRRMLLVYNVTAGSLFLLLTVSVMVYQALERQLDWMISTAAPLTAVLLGLSYYMQVKGLHVYLWAFGTLAVLVPFVYWFVCIC
ncbi:hypothetical protein [Bacillus marinisedimentorum]|uniref:hypothetical protein n=1 Tax=Bacillus marinisedimentorum TaxID=1821260 RepID=UPI0007E00054|nr:hypothetical protein [Bacillus marinisedimentorum]